MDQFHFISDLHLCEQRPDITAALFHYLRHRARDTQKLYILGDFFEYWIGDDAKTALNQQVAEELCRLKQHGTEIFFCHGNRDFLLGEQYCQQSGLQLLDELSIIEICGKSALLLHGDTLCTDDKEYLAFRNMVRNPQWQHAFLSKSIAERLAIAQQLREQSQQAAQEKSMQIMDVNTETVRQTFADHNVDLIIHGHTHRPAIHSLGDKVRIVLGDWDKQAWLLRADETKYALIPFNLSEL